MGFSEGIQEIKHLWNAFKWHFKRKKLNQVQSKGEMLIKSWLAYSNIKFEEQYEIYLPQLKTSTNLAYIDFLVKRYDGQKIAIEFNGRQHYEYVPFFHHNDKHNLELQQYRDTVVKDWCESCGYIFLEIPYYYNTDEVIKALKLYL